MNDEFQERTEFVQYGEQPKVFAIAYEVRSALWLGRVIKKNKMKRREDFNEIDRISGRLAFVHEAAWYLNSLTRRGRSWIRLAPKSPNGQWLKRQGYMQTAF